MIVWATGYERLIGKRKHSFGQETIQAGVSRLNRRLSSGRTSGQRGRAVLAKDADPSRYQPIRPLCDIGVAVATGDSSLLRGTLCRQTV